jgi:tetratricopeptide (TPR) repeat protein
VQVLQQLTQEFPAVAALRAELGANHLSHARTLYQCGQVQEAIRAFETARELAEKLVAEFPQTMSYRRALSLCLHDLAVVLLQVGLAAEAQACLRQAVVHQNEVIAAAPHVPQYRVELERIEQLLSSVPVA